MRIRIVSDIGEITLPLAAVLEAQEGWSVDIRSATSTTYELCHSNSIGAADLHALMRALRPLSPPMKSLPGLEGADAELRLGDTTSCGKWDVSLKVDSKKVAAEARRTLASLGLTYEGTELEYQEESQLMYGGATPFVRHAIRWLLAHDLGIELEERKAWSDGDDDIWLYLRDPEHEAKKPGEYLEVEVLSDDLEAAEALCGRLRSGGFTNLSVRELDSSTMETCRFELSPGPFAELDEDSAGVDGSRLGSLFKSFLSDRGVDSTRFPVVNKDNSAPMSARILMPMGALEGGRIRPYAGPYPERFAVTVETDKPDELTGLVEELEGMGFASVQTAPLSGELRGFSIIWSGSSDEPTVAGPLEAVVRRAMEEIGAEGFSLETVKLGDDSSPQRIVVQIPTEGIDDGSLRERLRARASRFDLSIHKHSSEDWPELCEELRSYGFGSVSQRTGSRDREIRYGGAPSYLISEIKALVLEHVGVDIPVEKAWPDSDNDIWLFLPRQDDSAIRSEEEGDNTGDFDVDSWLREVDSDPGEPTPFVHVEAESLRVGDVTLRRLSGPRHESAPDPGAFAHYCLDEHTAATLAHVATCALLREPCLLEGETSTSKTSSVLYLASLLNQPVARLNLNGQTDTGELIGRFVPQDLALELPFRPDDLRESSDLLEPETKLILTRADEESRALSALEVQQIMANERMHSHPWRWHDGLVVQAMRHGWWVILDEVNLAEPQILERLNSVLERDPYLVVTEHCNEVIGGSKTPVHPSFRIFATMNPAEYAGRSTLSPAYRDRWRGYRYVSPPGERGYLAMLRYLVYGAQPPVTLRGRAYTGGSATVPALGSLAEIDHIAELLTALARFHAGLEAAVRSEDGTARLGARRKERYVFTRRGLLSVMDFLGSVLAGEDGTQKILAFRRALLRYYVGRVATSADRNVVVRLLDAAGIGPNTWSIGAPGESSGGDGDSDGGPDSGDQGGDR